METKNDSWLKMSNKKRIDGRTKNFWVKIRNKETYYDVLIGKKGRKAHIHYGINPDLTITFLEDRKGVENIKHELITPEGKVFNIEDKVFPEVKKELTLSYKGVCRGDGKKNYLDLTEIRIFEEESHEINDKQKN